MSIASVTLIWLIKFNIMSIWHFFYKYTVQIMSMWHCIFLYTEKNCPIGTRFTNKNNCSYVGSFMYISIHRSSAKLELKQWWMFFWVDFYTIGVCINHWHKTYNILLVSVIFCKPIVYFWDYQTTLISDVVNIHIIFTKSDINVIWSNTVLE